MEDNNILTGELTFKTLDGKEFIFDKCKIVSIQNEPNNDYYINDYNYFKENNYSLEIQFKLNCKRKRFIKLLMARGLQKKIAIALADYSLGKYGFYNQELLLFFNIWR